MKIGITNKQRQNFVDQVYEHVALRNVARLLPCANCKMTGTNLPHKQTRCTTTTKCRSCGQTMRWNYSTLKAYSKNLQESRKILLEKYKDFDGTKKTKTKPVKSKSVDDRLAELEKENKRLKEQLKGKGII